MHKGNQKFHINRTRGYLTEEWWNPKQKKIGGQSKKNRVNYVWVDIRLINGKMSLTSFREVDREGSVEIKSKRSNKMFLELKWLMPTGMERKSESKISAMVDPLPTTVQTDYTQTHTSNHMHIVCMT